MGILQIKLKHELQSLKVLRTTQHFLLEQLCANKLHFKLQSFKQLFQKGPCKPKLNSL
jgi:hypothetical protein